MKNTSALITLAFIVIASLHGCAAQPRQPDLVTQHIVQASAAEWPSFGRDYSNQRFSPLAQINQENVSQLKKAWHYRSGVTATF
ncbi:MAG TPA: pyrrolo-quinoline quinone, partial [Methylophilaceae bacterium]|nr:pyrrolo-quinoline quinone [Methylophilaceae bacterium]